MKRHKFQSLVLIAGIASMALASGSLARADSIAISFGDNLATTTGADQVGATQTAGVVSQSNWNNAVTGTLSGSVTSLDGTVKTPSGSTIVDNTGTATTVTGNLWAGSNTYNIAQTTNTAPDASNGDQLMMNGGIYSNSNSSFNNLIIQVNNVPYAEYDVYVYGLVDHAGAIEHIGLGDSEMAGTTHSFNADAAFSTGGNAYTVWEKTPTPNAVGYIDGTSPTGFTYTQAVSTAQASPTPNADYAEFTNVLGPSFSVAAYATNYNGAIEGVQIVDLAPGAATVSNAGTSVPVAGVADQSNLNPTGTVNTSNNIAGAPNFYTNATAAPGQLFTTGSNAQGYTLTSVTLKDLNEQGGLTNNNPVGLDIVAINGASYTIIGRYTGSVSSVGTGDYVTISVPTGLTLNADTQYGFFVFSAYASHASGYGTGNTNPYTGLALDTSATDYIGGNIAAFNSNGTFVSDPNLQSIFDVGLTAVVPEPASLAIFGIGAMGLLGLGRRKAVNK